MSAWNQDSRATLDGTRSFWTKIGSAADGVYHVTCAPSTPRMPIILIERGDTVTGYVLMAAALTPRATVVRNASCNYMVQDLCFFLQKLGVSIEGIGTTQLKIPGISMIVRDVDYCPSEDPIEAMTFIAAAVVTSSSISIRRAPMKFLELELAVLAGMGLQYDVSEEYKAANGFTRLADLTINKSLLVAPKDKVHAMLFPGVNMDNLPFLGLIAATAHGSTLVHDWSYENRARYFSELEKLGAQVECLDPHRSVISGPTKWTPASVTAPAALRSTVVILLAMLASSGISELYDTRNQIKRGHENLMPRLRNLGASVEECSHDFCDVPVLWRAVAGVLENASAKGA